MNPTLIRTATPDPRHRPEAIAERILPADLRRGRGAATNATGRFELQKREEFDDGWTRDEAPSRWPPRSPGKSPRRSSPATSRPTLASTGRSIPIAAASMAAFIAMRGRPTPIWGFPPGSISKPAVRQRARRRASGARARLAQVQARAHRLRRQHRPLSADRAAISHHSVADRGRSPTPGTRSPSSPNRTSFCATSTSWRRWRATTWSRSSSR